MEVGWVEHSLSDPDCWEKRHMVILNKAQRIWLLSIFTYLIRIRDRVCVLSTFSKLPITLSHQLLHDPGVGP